MEYLFIVIVIAFGPFIVKMLDRTYVATKSTHFGKDLAELLDSEVK